VPVSERSADTLAADGSRRQPMYSSERSQAGSELGVGGLLAHGLASVLRLGLDAPCEPRQQVLERASGEPPADDTVADPPDHSERRRIGPLEPEPCACMGREGFQLSVESWKQPFPPRRLPGHGHYDCDFGGLGVTQLQDHLLVHAGTGAETDAQFRGVRRVILDRRR
jgi:hypothetical protein